MTGEPPDQQALWTGKYDATSDANPEPSAFLRECASLIPPGSRVLELGCGGGADAAALGALGHDVIATDFVASVIARNQRRHIDDSRLHFREMRIDDPFPFLDGAFDIVYAHLTLHYFTDEVTKRIFREIRRVVRLGGMLMFACKSDRDPLYGRGVEIEPDMFDLDGHIRHFFSGAYARACLAEGFSLNRLKSRTGRLYDNSSAWITAIARADHAQDVGRVGSVAVMKRVLLTGMSGTGKSTVIGELASRGYKTVDTDYDGLSVWTGTEWLWDEDRIQWLLSTDDAEALFLSGTTRNQVTFYPQFDHVILLSAPVQVIVERLATRTTNDYGKHPEELAEVLGFQETIEPLLRRGASLEVDTSAPLDQVIETILAHVRL